jgi:hypothetical protein
VVQNILKKEEYKFLIKTLFVKDTNAKIVVSGLLLIKEPELATKSI